MVCSDAANVSYYAIGVLAEYQWNCSEPNKHGERYIPGVREYSSDVEINVINEHEIRLHRVENLTVVCTGEVTAIEFCYRYYSTEPGEAIFNWTVLFLKEESGSFKVTKVYSIKSRPNSLPENDCQNDTRVPGTIKCCDRENITSFDLDLQRNDFIFGVTESAQGNTHNVALLGFHSSLPEYNVDTMLVSKAALMMNISVGYVLPKPSGARRGLHMLWFVIGQSAGIINTATLIFVNYLVSSPTGNTTTTRSTSPITDRFTTLFPISESTTLTSSEALTTTFTAISTPSRGSDSNVNQISRVQSDVGVVVGSVIGTVVPVTILLSVVAILTLALVHLARKYKSITKGRETRITAAQNTYTLDMDMNSNDAYVLSRSRLDSMESNAAYGGVTVNQDTSNNMYETIGSNEISSEDITQAHDSIETHNEEDFTGGTVYEYIDKDDRYV